MNRIVLLRHGRTRHNAESRLQGAVDLALDPAGREQMARAGEYLRERFDVRRVITSASKRATESATAAGLDDLGPGVEVGIDDRWREMAFGTLDGRRVGEVVAGLVARWADDIHHAPDGGESMAAVHDRVGEAWADVLGSRTAGATVVVTHATPIKSAVIHALRGSPSQILSLRVDVGSVSVIGVPRPFSPVLEVFNDVSHLD